MVLVCERHHTLIHGTAEGMGFQLTLTTSGTGTALRRTLVVTTADGTHVPQHPAMRELTQQDRDALDPEQHVTAATLPPVIDGTRIDWDHAVWSLAQHAA